MLGFLYIPEENHTGKLLTFPGEGKNILVIQIYRDTEKHTAKVNN